MCLLIIANEFPRQELLNAGERANKDGAGISWIEGNKVKYLKGLTAEQLGLLRGTIPAPYMIHFRMASIGEVNPLLTHPFPITNQAELSLSGEAESVLAHNGHWSDWSDTLLRQLSSTFRMPDGLWSDTRAIAMFVSLHGTNFLHLLSDYQKIGVMDKSGITMHGTFIKDKEQDIFLSNDHFHKYTPADSSRPKNWSIVDDSTDPWDYEPLRPPTDEEIDDDLRDDIRDELSYDYAWNFLSEDEQDHMIDEILEQAWNPITDVVEITSLMINEAKQKMNNITKEVLCLKSKSL